MNRRCNQCGSELIFVKETVESRDMSSPVTTVIYRCSDAACQKEIDRRAVAQVEHNKRLAATRLDRYKNRAGK